MGRIVWAILVAGFGKMVKNYVITEFPHDYLKGQEDRRGIDEDVERNIQQVAEPLAGTQQRAGVPMHRGSTRRPRRHLDDLDASAICPAEQTCPTCAPSRASRSCTRSRSCAGGVARPLSVAHGAVRAQVTSADPLGKRRDVSNADASVRRETDGRRGEPRGLAPQLPAGRASSSARPWRVIAVVKADGYGHGAVARGARIPRGGRGGARRLDGRGGVELRRAGITAPDRRAGRRCSRARRRRSCAHDLAAARVDARPGARAGGRRAGRRAAPCGRAPQGRHRHDAARDRPRRRRARSARAARRSSGVRRSPASSRISRRPTPSIRWRRARADRALPRRGRRRSRGGRAAAARAPREQRRRAVRSRLRTSRWCARASCSTATPPAPHLADARGAAPGDASADGGRAGAPRAGRHAGRLRRHVRRGARRARSRRCRSATPTATTALASNRAAMLRARARASPVAGRVCMDHTCST